MQYQVFTCILHCVHEKNYNTVYVAITLADFNEILHQHCGVKWQTVTKFQEKSCQHLQQLQQV